MSQTFLSRKTLTEFREHFSHRSSLGPIRDEFSAASISRDADYQPPDIHGERRTLVEQYYHTLDLGSWEDAQKLLKVFEATLDKLESIPASSTERQDATREMDKLVRCLQKDGFTYQDGSITSQDQIILNLQVAAPVDAPNLRTQIKRMHASVESDPRLAISTAKALVETTCKTILSARGKACGHAPDIGELVKAVRSELKLAPSDIPDSAKAADTIKRILSSLTTIVQGLAELRNAYGADHGPEARTKGLEPRHARLAAGAAATLATFLFETHSARKKAQKA